jgi:predicted transglutaminase-like cysteine proteinase
MNCLLKAAVLAVAAFAAAPAMAASPALFNTVEYRTDSLDALPQWQRAMAEAAREQKTFAGCAGSAEGCGSKGVQAWQTMIGEQRNRRQIDQLRIVNDFINQWRYRADQQNYGRSDYWASPAEFFSRSGDCEDYAIAKYATLRQMGFGAEQLRMVVVKDVKRGLAHAVLAAYVDGDVFILDNLSNQVRPQASVTEYAPYYSVNEQARWAHAAAPAPAKVASATDLFSKS